MEIPKIGFGTYRLNGHTKESVLFALKNGVSHIDTAPLYKNEQIVGDAIRESGIPRNKLFIATKISRNELKSGSIKESIRASLLRIGVDYLDLVVLHEPINIKENWQKLCEFHKLNQNIVRNIGVSNFDVVDLQEIIDSSNCKPYVNQIEMNIFMYQEDTIEYCKSNGIKIVAHSPLAKAEKMTNETLNTIASKYQKTPAQIMLRWLIHHDAIVIPRSKECNHILENKTLDFDICDNDINTINSLNCMYATHPQYLRKNRVVAK